MPDIMGIGTSGLLAFQRALSTTGHNISNVNTEGYSRQRVELATRIPEFSGAGYLGQGVSMIDVERTYDQFTVAQVRNYTSSHLRAETYYDFASQIDNLLADPLAGLTPTLEEFFDAVHGVSDSPSSIAARQVMLTSADTLTSRFHYIDNRLGELNERANKELEFSIDEVNSLATQIAELNERITVEYGRSGGRAPNDLLDRRDLMLQKLSEYVNVSVIEEKSGSVNVTIGNGQSLVVGTTVTELNVRPDEFYKDKYVVVIGDQFNGPNITEYLGEGALGGAIDFTNNLLTETRRSLGRIAIGLADSFNTQHNLGLDLNNLAGKDFFSVAPADPLGSDQNSTVNEPTVTVTDISQLTTDDYMLDYDDATDSWTVTNRKTGVATGPVADGGLLTVDGLEIDTSAVGGAGAGDFYQFIISGTFDVSRTIEVNVDEPEDIAVAGILRGGEAADANGQSLIPNAGSGVISEVTVSNNNFYPLGVDITLTYDDVAKQFTLGAPAVGGPIPYDADTDDGQPLSFDIPAAPANTTVTFRVQGRPASNDVFVIQDNLDATADNRNSLALADLETSRLLVDGSTSFQSAYGQMVSEVGTSTHEAEVARDAQSTLLGLAVEQRESISGVNLDEEAANLIRFQQAYQATAKVIGTANQLFQDLLNVI